MCEPHSILVEIIFLRSSIAKETRLDSRPPYGKYPSCGQFSDLQKFKGMFIFSISNIQLCVCSSMFSIAKGYFGDLTAHSSRFKGNFGHFRGFRVLLVILKILNLFWSIKRFGGGGVWTFCDFWGILVILGVHSSFQWLQRGILEIWVVILAFSWVFWSF